LLEIGDLLAISKEVVFRTSDFTAMVEKISITCKMKGQVSLAEVRDLFGTSRRYAQALLEYLDSIGLTIRSGDFRRLKTSDG
jgi:selenocysteine-specific elongation factor